MIRYVVTHLLLAVQTLVLISIVTFLATNVVPGDPARAALGRGASTAQLDAYRHQQGLDRPPVERYFRWLGQMTRGDWGSSVTTGLRVRETVQPRILRTVTIGLLAMALALPVALALGVFTGKRGGTRLDVGVSIVSLFLGSLPEFVIGIFLLVLLGVKLAVLPVESSAVAYGTLSQRLEGYLLPSLTLTLVVVPYLTRMVRANVREVLPQPYVRAATLRGLSARRVTWSHVVPNALPPVVNVVALNLAELIAGVVVVEAVFGFPGIGNLLVSAVRSRDIPTVQAVTLVVGTVYVVLNFASDALVAVLSPRLRSR